MPDSSLEPGNTFFFKRNPILWNAVITMGVVAILLFSLVVSHRMAANYFPLADAALQVQLDAVQGHLQLENIISGENDEDISVVWEYFDHCEHFVSLMIEGESHREKMILMLRGPKLQAEIEIMKATLMAFRRAAEHRWDTHQASGEGLQDKQRLSHLLNKLLAQADIVESAIDESRAKEFNKFQVVQGILILVVLGFSIFSGAIMGRFGKKQAQVNLALLESQKNYEIIFEDSPVPLWEEDFSEVLSYYEELDRVGIKDIRSHFDSNPEALVACSKKIQIRKINKAAVVLHQAGSKENLLLNLDKIFTDNSYEVFKEELISISEGVSEFESEAEVKTLSGEVKNIFLKLTMDPICLGPGRALLATVDITEKTKLEAQLRQAQKMESVGLLAGGVAHDFNNMLAVILGNTELALEEVNEHQPIHIMLEGIKRAGNRSADLTRQLLAFARKQTIAPRVLDLDDVLAESLILIRRLIGENIDLEWLPGPGGCFVKMDPSQIDQIITNLCVNSRDAIDGIGKIIIETRFASLDDDYCFYNPGFSPGDFVLLNFSDNGCGMNKETLDRIYEPFYSTKQTGDGSGLGMSTVYGIIKQNKGYIKVYSEVGRGTTINIYLPRFEAVIQEQKPVDSSETIELGTETVLLVEDEETLLEMITRMLDSHGYTVLTASNPEEAIVLAAKHQHKIQLLLSDIVLPGMSGLDLSTHLLESLPDLKYIFMSGYSANVIAHNGVLDEGLNFIQKPFGMDDLLRKVRNTLDLQG